MNFDKNDVFEYLDKLRESGITNMYGAGPYIEAQFDLRRSEAFRLLAEWMETFTERHPMEG